MVRSHRGARLLASKPSAWLTIGSFVSSTLVASLALVVPGADAQGGVYHCPKGTAPCVVHGNGLVPAASVIYGGRGDDRIWGGHGYDVIYGGPGRDRLHNFQAAGGRMYGSGDDICVIGVKPGGEINVTYTGCAKVIFKLSQGHG